jgi:hypothetical protein
MMTHGPKEAEMAHMANELQITYAARDRYPRAFGWHGRQYRVLSLEGVRVVSHERRYRLATNAGCFELAQTASGSWLVRRAPGWLDRVLVRWQNTPRYPLPAWRRRSYQMALLPVERRASFERRVSLERLD